MERSRFLILLSKWKEGDIPPEEKQELHMYVQDEENREEIVDWLLESGIEHTEFPNYNGQRFEPIFKEIVGSDKPSKVIEIRAGSRKAKWRWIAAASIILVLGVASYFVLLNNKSEVGGQKTEVTKTNDVPAPRDSRAVIVLADGTKVYLDSVDNGTVAQQGGANVIKTADGKIVYSSEKLVASSELIYNTLSNPLGSKVIDMQLSDGSHVWLNAGSSVKYPVAFVGGERKVEITGEAYFEVSHNASKPFIVTKGETSVTVLGTHFNVNAYDDEEALRVTLLEGSVKVEFPVRKAHTPLKRGMATHSVVIKPGEQAAVINDIKVSKGVNVEEVMAWKNGLFKFNSTDIQTMMRQAERWYNISVSYPNGIPSDKFGGTLSRSVNLSEFVKILEYSEIKASIEGNNLKVFK